MKIVIGPYWKNLWVLCLSVFIVMSSYFAAVNLQSSLNAENNLGVVCLAILNCLYGVSSLTAPVIIKYLGTKWTIVIASACMCSYSAANLYSDFITLVPASILVGLALGPCFSARATHITTSAINWAKKEKRSTSNAISRFNGICYVFFIGSHIPGNLVSSLVLYQKDYPNGENVSSALLCGSQDCRAEDTLRNNSLNLSSNHHDVKSILFGTLLLCGVVGTVIGAVFLDTLPSYCDTLSEDKSLRERFGAVLHLILTPKFLLFAPMVTYTAAEMGFAYTDFTKSYISCFSGIRSIGFVMSAYGAGGAISSLVTGAAVKYVTRIAVFTFGFLLHITLICWMLQWDSSNGQEWHLYCMAALWGVGSMLRTTLVSAVLGEVFADDQSAAYASYNLCHAVVFAVYYGIGAVKLCIYYLLYTLLVWISIAMLMYYCLEWLLRKTRNTRITR